MIIEGGNPEFFEGRGIFVSNMLKRGFDKERLALNIRDAEEHGCAREVGTNGWYSVAWSGNDQKPEILAKYVSESEFEFYSWEIELRKVGDVKENI